MFGDLPVSIHRGIRMQLPFAPAVIAAMLVALLPANCFAQEPAGFDPFAIPFEISCRTLMVADYPPAINRSSYSQPPTPVDFNIALCARQLGTSKASDLAKPLSEYFYQHPQDWSPDESEETRAARIAADKARSRILLGDLRKNIGPLFEFCRSLTPPPKAGYFRICYFGIAYETASAPAKAAFNTILHNRLSSEAICNPEPVDRRNADLPEFREFLSNNASTLTWQDIVENLTRDGFACESEACMGAFFSLVLLPKHMRRSTIFDGDFFFPRLVGVYRGRWMKLGPDYKERTVPERGSPEGICMAPEDNHNWAMIWAYINGYE